MNNEPTSYEDTERIPPHSIEAEQAVLGSILVSGDAISKVVDRIHPESFYKRSHRLIYSALIDLFEHQEPLDIIATSQYLKDKGILEMVGGRQYLADLAMSIATTANVEYYAQMVYDRALLRSLITTGEEIVATSFAETDANVALDTAERLVFGLAQRKQLKQLTPMSEIVGPSFARIEERYANRDSLAGHSSGFYDLDAMTNGFQPSDLIIIAARPAMGKTSFCTTIAQFIAIEKNVPVAIFSLEMSKESLTQRMLCSEAKIDSERLRKGQLHNNDWSSLSMALGKLGDAPLYIDDSAVLTVLDIRAKARRLKAEKHELGLIVIDYIQLLQGRKQTDHRVQEISEITRGLKQLARELDVPVIALSQLSRAVESRPSKIPMLSDLRESGSIEQDADIVMFIYRDEYYNPESDRRGEAEIIIAKHRNGPTGKVDLLFQASMTRFLNKIKVTNNAIE